MLRIPLLAAALATGPGLADAETASVGGLDIYYEVHGDLADGETPFLLLHGGLMDIDSAFADLIPLLSDTAAVIAVDQQGHGRTGDRDAPITLESLRADTLGVLDALGVEQAHVVGFSLGAMQGLDLSVDAPDRVASLTAISGSAGPEGMRPEIVAMNRNPGTPPDPAVVPFLPTEEDFAAMQAAYADNPSGPETMMVAMEKVGRLIIGDWGWSDEQLATVAAPVLVVIGDTDFILPTHAAHMAEAIPDTQLAILPDATHMTVLDHADWIAEMIENRIDGSDE